MKDILREGNRTVLDEYNWSTLKMSRGWWWWGKQIFVLCWPL